MAKRNKNNRGSGGINEAKPGTTGAIQQRAPAKLDRVVFCFKYLDCANKTFSIDQLPRQFGKWLLEKFRGYGQMPFNAFAPGQGNSQIHSHIVDVERINAHGGFKLIPQDLWIERPWQIAIQGKIRAVGFIRDSIFHVVWIDQDHKFDPGKGR